MNVKNNKDIEIIEIKKYSKKINKKKYKIIYNVILELKHEKQFNVILDQINEIKEHCNYKFPYMNIILNKEQMSIVYELSKNKQYEYVDYSNEKEILGDWDIESREAQEYIRQKKLMESKARDLNIDVPKYILNYKLQEILEKESLETMVDETDEDSVNEMSSNINDSDEKINNDLKYIDISIKSEKEYIIKVGGKLLDILSQSDIQSNIIKKLIKNYNIKIINKNEELEILNAINNNSLESYLKEKYEK